MLVGQDPLNVEAIWERIRTTGIFAGAQGGQYVTALTGVEIALWDLAGKALGFPSINYSAASSATRSASTAIPTWTTRWAPRATESCRGSRIKGFTAMKIDIDDARDPRGSTAVNWTASNGEIDRMVKWVAHVRESIPKEMDLACDMHGRYDAPTGKKVAKQLEPFRLLWLEEPVPPEDIDAMADIRHSTTTPICCGENLYMRWGYTRAAAEAGRGHHHAGHPEVRRARRGQEDRQHGASLLHPIRAALRGLAHRTDGLGARLRGRSEFPGLRMALDQSSGPLEDLGQGGRDHRRTVTSR